MGGEHCCGIGCPASQAMTDWKPVRLRRGSLIHVSDTESLVETACGFPMKGAIYAVDAAPTCKKCLRAMLDELN